jgi:hypothetical protein
LNQLFDIKHQKPHKTDIKHNDLMNAFRQFPLKSKITLAKKLSEFDRKTQRIIVVSNFPQHADFPVDWNARLSCSVHSVGSAFVQSHSHRIACVPFVFLFRTKTTATTTFVNTNSTQKTTPVFGCHTNQIYCCGTASQCFGFPFAKQFKTVVGVVGG